MKTRLFLFVVLITVTLGIGGCNPDTIEDTEQVLIAQDSINQVLSQLHGNWYMYRQLKVKYWNNCDGLICGAYTENRTTNLAFSDFKFIFTPNIVSLGLGSLQFNFSGNPHSDYMRLQVNGYNDYYAISKEGDNYYLYNNVNNAGWSYSMSGKHAIQFQGDTLMSLYEMNSWDSEWDLYLFKKSNINESPENIEGLNGTFQLTSKENISSGVITYVQNYTDGALLAFTNEMVAPDVSTYSYIPGAYKGLWYKANFGNSSSSAFLGPWLDYIYTMPGGDFCYSTSEKFSDNNGRFLDVGNAQFEIVNNDGINLVLRKGNACYYTDWHFIKVN